jgi:Fur family transcriptional regulator, ferric uptake regulator
MSTRKSETGVNQFDNEGESADIKSATAGAKRGGDLAETLIRSTGERLTTARVQVLRVLLEAGRALSHHEVEQRVGREMPIDRVTIYRVLEWLTRERLAHKIAGDDRVWRFDAPAQGNSENRAHFKCTNCGNIVGLEHQFGTKSLKVPSGYIPKALEVIVRGLCVNCSGNA